MIAEKLLEQGADVNSGWLYADGATSPVEAAVQKNDPDMFRILMKWEPHERVDDLIFLAVRGGHLAVLREMSKMGINLDIEKPAVKAYSGRQIEPAMHITEYARKCDQHNVAMFLRNMGLGKNKR